MVEAIEFDGLLNIPRLQRWMDEQEALDAGRIEFVDQLTGGTQNNLFRIRCSSRTLVLRRPPKHLRKNSNETMLREARVLRAIAATDVPHPVLHAACDDPSVIGACFYLMASLDGFAPARNVPLPGAYGQDPTWRRAMGRELVKSAARLAAVDHVEVGLADFGRADNWHQRQPDRWRGQVETYLSIPGYGTILLPYMDEVHAWLDRNCPTDGRIGIIHGDYQFPNVMFAHDRPELVGLIDWELATLGDPMLDMAWVLASWWEENIDPPGKFPSVSPWDGFQSRDDLVRQYGDLTERDMSSMPWYFALACFKLGCILEGTFARSLAGLAPKDIGDRLHHYAVWLLTKARQITAEA